MTTANNMSSYTVDTNISDISPQACLQICGITSDTIFAISVSVCMLTIIKHIDCSVLFDVSGYMARRYRIQHTVHIKLQIKTTLIKSMVESIQVPQAPEKKNCAMES